MKTLCILSTASLGFGAIAVSWFFLLQYRKRRLAHPGKDWIYVGEIGALNFFPIKSCAAVDVERADCNKDGLSLHNIRDRNLLLLDDDNKLVSYIAHPDMLSLKVEIVSNQNIHLSAPNTPPISINMEQIIRESAAREEALGGYRLLLVECKPKHHRWVSKVVLKRTSGLRLFITLDASVERKWWKVKKEDLYPIMVINDQSIKELNSRLDKDGQVDHLRFRSNILVHSEFNHGAFFEDHWDWMKIGDRYGQVDNTTILRATEPCRRCAIISFEADTCKSNTNCEPLAALKKFRLITHPMKPDMGMYFDVYKTGKVYLGDPVYIQWKKN